MENDKNGSNVPSGRSSENDAKDRADSSRNNEQQSTNHSSSEQYQNADAKYYQDAEGDERRRDNVSNDGAFTNDVDDLEE